jgi:hypothetical protein
MATGFFNGAQNVIDSAFYIATSMPALMTYAAGGTGAAIGGGIGALAADEGKRGEGAMTGAAWTGGAAASLALGAMIMASR